MPYALATSPARPGARGSMDRVDADPLALPAADVAVGQMADDVRAATQQAQEEERPAPKPLVLVSPPVNAEDASRRRRAMAALYGDAFPGLKDQPTREAWCQWGEDRWDAHAGPQRPRVHAAQRNRSMRSGSQWISSNNGGPWRSPPRQQTKIRATVNMIGPALDWRLQVQTEQRPGVRAVPLTTDPDDVRRGQANNRFLDYQHRQQRFNLVLREAMYYAQTDGVSFLHPYWDPNAGPLLRDPATNRMMRAGDVRTCTLTLEQVRVSANATATVAPYYWVVAEEISLAEAVFTYGDQVIDSDGARSAGLVNQQVTPGAGVNGMAGPGTLTAAGELRLAGQQTVRKTTVFCEPSEYLPNGLTLVTVGRTVVFLYGLLCGRAPIVPFRDGTSDPAFYPVPQMEQWIEPQMQLNAAYSMLLHNVRVNAGGKYAYRHGAVRPDSFVGGQDVNIEVRSQNPLSDVLQPIQGFSIGQDALGLIERCVQRLEDLTGYNEVARGGVTNESGRAILAIREQLERTFAPGVYAACEGVKGWAAVTLAWGAAFYDVPRAIRTLGKGRPDLGRLITKDDLDGAADVDLDAETMMPVPSSVRRFELKELLSSGVIKFSEFRRRYGLAFLDDLETPDEMHASRAYRFVDAMRQLDEEGRDVAEADATVEMLWQDDEAIWQEILDRELILAPDVPDAQRFLAMDRWDALAKQAKVKAESTPMGGAIPSPFDPQNPERAALAARPDAAMAPGAVPGAPAAPGAPGAMGAPPAPPGEAPPGLPPGVVPTAAMPPGPMSAPPMMADQSLQADAARRFEAGALQ